MIQQFPIKEINGTQLASELNLSLYDVWVDETSIYINSEIDKSELEKAIKAHKPLVKTFTIKEKLEAAGIELDELRVALGL